jgi:diguanylate cyclase (GGDEF)-like protein
MFLAIVALTVVAAGVLLLPPQVRQFAATVSGSLAASPGAGAAPARQPRAGTAADAKPAPRSAYLPAYALGVFLAGTVLGAILWVAVQRRRSTATPWTWRHKLSVPAPPEPVQIRAFAKRQQLWRALLTDGDLLLRNGLEVRHLMTRNPLKVSPSATVSEMRQIFAASRVHHLLVCQGDCLLGVISDRDLSARAGKTAGRMIQQPLYTVTPHTSLGTAIQTLVEHNISCLPVLEGGQLSGILSTTDLVLTLQCSLQLWLRMAQGTRAGAAWAAEIEALSGAVGQAVIAEQQEVAELRRLLDAQNAGQGPPPAEAFTRKATSFLTAAARLAVDLNAARDRLTQEAKRWVSLSDLRTDAATGLANHRELDSVLELLLAIGKRYHQPFSLALVTIDGYSAADAASAARFLQTAVRRIVDTIRNSDFAARLEEGTFAVVLTHTPSGGAIAFCNRLLAAARRLPDDDKLTFSIGLTSSEEEDSGATIQERAQTLLAEAVAAGGNCLHASEPDRDPADLLPATL